VSLEHVALPTLAVVGTWIWVGGMLAGCGYLTRRALLHRLSDSPADGLRVGDMWAGLAVLIAYLQIWSLLRNVGWIAWVAPAAAGLAGTALGARRLGSLRGRRPALGVLALAGLGTLWLANQALAAARDYDLGLYHLGAVEYASRYATIPGLANLQPRFGAGDAHLLFVSFLGRGPWGGAAPHLANGLLVSMLFADVASRFAFRREAPRPASFTRRMALLLVPASIAVAGASTGYRLSSPNLDLAAFVLVAVGALYLAESVEHGFLPAAALTSTAAFALAAATRPFYWLLTLIAAGLFGFAAKRGPAQGPSRLLRAVALINVLPGGLLLGWLARQAILSGYPFFPSTVGGLPVNWRIPASVVHDQNRWTGAWARWPGKSPGQILGSWHWLGHWLHARARDIDVIAPLMLLAAFVPSLLTRDHERAARRAPMLVVLIPALLALVMWFVVAPDPRFALAPLWLVAVAVAAWALPALERRLPPPALLCAALAAGGLAFIGIHALVWLFLAAFDAWALVAVALRLFGPQRLRALAAHAALLSLALTPIGVVAHRGAFHLIDAHQAGTLGTPPEPVPTLVSFTTSSGLKLWQPAGGGDQCWQATLCVPQGNTHVRLRGARISDGFALNP
jgi:hypothetical protein